MEIGKRLKDLRDSINLLQLKFVVKSGISQTTYSHYETWLNLITTMNACAIYKTYNISLDYLVGRVNKKAWINNILKHTFLFLFNDSMTANFGGYHLIFPVIAVIIFLYKHFRIFFVFLIKIFQ